MPEVSFERAPSDASNTLVVDLISSDAWSAPAENAWMGGSKMFRVGGGAGCPEMSSGSYSRYDQGTTLAVAQRGSLKIPLTPIHGAFVPSATTSASLER